VPAAAPEEQDATDDAQGSSDDTA